MRRLSVAVLAAASFAFPAGGRGLAAASSAPKPTPATHTLPRDVGRGKGGDFDAMLERRLIRVLVPYSKTGYFIDRGMPRGTAVDAFKLFEDYLNQKYKTGNLRLHVVLVPMQRDNLAAALFDGRGDVVAASVTVTPERLAKADFADPVLKNVSEIVVGSPEAPPVAAAEDLSGREVFVRKTSIFHESVEKLNAELAKKGKAPVRERFAPDNLEDEDLLEMASANLVSYVVVDDYLARFWGSVLPKLKLYPDATLRTGGEIAWAIRKDSPKLKAELNAFLAKYPEGSATRNMIFQKYLRNTKFVTNANSLEARERFKRTVALFKTYGDKYDVDYVLMAAQGYQESQLDQNAKSHVGAVGVMQLMPATGKEQNVGDITQLEPNIHAGVKYMRFMVDQYFAKEPMDKLDKGLFAFAAYNAGPGRIQTLRREAARRGLDPNKWFDNVEVVASEKIGRETVTYVANIYKYYVAYTLALEDMAERQKAIEEVKAKP
ncbi:MAG TPA: transporter substrate-binding domain-containing protein [Thermoanaerobaculia bacterium]|nr:transporter substrate-binding domain-containing protein [Thermoanaerobaculia bacterium]